MRTPKHFMEKYEVIKRYGNFISDGISISAVSIKIGGKEKYGIMDKEISSGDSSFLEKRSKENMMRDFKKLKVLYKQAKKDSILDLLSEKIPNVFGKRKDAEEEMDRE